MHIAFQILANGEDITPVLKDRLTGLSISDEAGIKSDAAEIQIDNCDHRVALPPVGAKLDISLGFLETGLTLMGRYVVDDLMGELMPATMTIHAKATDMISGIRAPKTRSWQNVSFGDIVQKIARENGLKAAVAKDIGAQRYGYIAQTSESDLNLLMRLAHDLDALVKPAGGAILCVRQGEGKTASGIEIPVPEIALKDITRGSWKLKSRGRYGKVITEWSELGSATVHKVTIGDGKPVLKLRHRYASKVEATRAAASALNRSKRGSGTLDLTLAGFNGALTAGGMIDLIDAAPELRGRWSIKGVTHKLSNTLTTHLKAERDNDKI